LVNLTIKYTIVAPSFANSFRTCWNGISGTSHDDIISRRLLKKGYPDPHYNGRVSAVVMLNLFHYPLGNFFWWGYEGVSRWRSSAVVVRLDRIVHRPTGLSTLRTTFILPPTMIEGDSPLLLVSSRNAIIAGEPVILHPRKSLAKPIANRISECSYLKRPLKKTCRILPAGGLGVYPRF
jgi:hypothetical protein